MKFFFPKGATPMDDISDLKLSWVHTLQDLNRVEAENIKLATKKYLLGRLSSPKYWFLVPQLIKMHYEMFHQVWNWAGKFRKTNKNLGSKPYLIPFELAQLCQTVQEWNSANRTISLREQAARIHHQLVVIHPFENGNGRFARLAADRYLRALKHPHPHWPLDLDNTSYARKRYLQVLREADQGNFDPFLVFMEEFGA
jgi:Fic-DOC domain mobile mystery protein B